MSPLATYSAVGRNSARTPLGPEEAAAVAENVFTTDKMRIDVRHSSFVASN
jgi:hypothetical protein